MTELYRSIFMKQKMMRKVLYSLIPVTLGSIYFYGWRTLVLMAVISVFGIFTEYLFKRKSNKKVSEAVLVTSILLTLTLPASTPFWVGIIGIIFGIVFAKEIFGGFGHNVFNPALAARTFLYVTFPEPMTVQWSTVSSGFPGGFARYLSPALDTITQSTPLGILRQGGEMLPLRNLFIGNTSGSLGEASAFLILVAAAYLLFTKTADWKLMLAPVIGFVGIHSILLLANVSSVPSPLHGLLSGGFLFMTVFMTTDPITAPKQTEAKWIYGLLIGIIASVIRIFGIFVGGAMFAVLIMNTFSPILDEGIKHLKSSKRKKVTA
ncbi:NQR2 and RnfD family protein [Alkaliphilus metalliredigens QYMF]|uniref:NQR2 and RnfD family protein n=1 Tax=Alkaliphilus metalliredigens (strain QYMF) TaxID=293826 RepID=A6TT06_ALKMQ|nr:RnfABCDGE type electron transport complex subunit D [Alkaliphilus metalliredigens]ABR49324.1 NQR2 and RnfD family protein [Alkaliphilus metalliredigens QYMF]